MHDVLITGIQTLIILIGILLNRANIKGVRGEMAADFASLRSEMNTRFDKVDAGIRACIDAGRRRSS